MSLQFCCPVQVRPSRPNRSLKIASRLRTLEMRASMRALEMTQMEKRLNPDIGRRDLLRVLAAGAGAVAASAAPLAATAAAERENADAAKKRRARYQPNSPEVQTFYRVNRYPAK
jgi:septal ring factor EnvC (AmiA/AmiB activator)